NARDRLQEEQVDQYLQEVVTAGHRARDLISQMLTFTRAQRGESKSVDLTTTISDVSRMLRAAIPTTIQVHTRFADTLPAVVIDPVQLQQVIINLLINARDAITGNGTIDIDVCTEQSKGYCRTCGEALHGPHVAISVKDSGHGIPADLIEKVFEMYFTTRAPDKGTGFGLWMINNFVHESQGHIQVNSTEGVGTEFRILLPAAAEETVPVTPGLVPAPKVEGRIVVVDDEVSVANFIGEVLRDRGYPTVVFTESPQALDYLQNNLQHVILLLTDGSMPLISGLELVEYVRSTDPELPVIYITGYTQTTDTQALQNLGVNMYLQKPFSIDEMMRAVATLTNLEDASAPADAADNNPSDAAKPSTSVH
ncbi:MAG: ATP-binding protein, partial [Pseudomonadota bacterium]